jgi:hypothetical protein
VTDKNRIETHLRAALNERKPLSLDLYVEALAPHESALVASLNDDADDTLLCVLVDEKNDAAMLVIDWDSNIYRNEKALEKLKAIWRQSFERNVEFLLPVFSSQIMQRNLGVAGLKWIPEPTGSD